MKLPRITIEYQEEETYALGKISVPHIVGFGLYWAWILLFVFNGSLLFYPDVQLTSDACSIAWLVVHPCVLACYGLFIDRVRLLFQTSRQRFRNRLIAAAAATLGMALTFAAPYITEALQLAVGVVAGALTGFGAAALVMSFGVSFSVCDLPTIAVCLAAAAPTTAVGYAAVIAVDAAAHPAGAVLTLCMPLALCALLYASSRRLIDNLEFSSLTLPVHLRPFMRYVCLMCLVFGVLIGLLRAGAASSAYRTDDLAGTLVAVVAAGLFAAFVIVGSLLTKHKTNNFLFRTIPPVAAALLAIIVLAQTGDRSLYSSFALFAAYFLMGACMWAFLADVSQNYRVSAFMVFGLGWSAHSLGAAAGQILTMHDAPLTAITSDSGSLVALALMLMTLGIALLPSDGEMRSTLKRGRYCPALVDFSMLTPDATTAAGTAPDAATTPAQPQPSAPAQPQPAQATPPAAPEKPPTPEAKAANDAHKAGRFKRKCMAVADRYLLSRKETEVLFLLAKGYKSAAIQETLYISEGTTNTHMRHIYRKLDVHSQKELMDLVDKEEVADEDFS